MKKIFSAILALAMSMSLCTFTAQAAGEAYYDVTYEAISVESGDVNKLAVGDTFYAVVTLKNAAGLFSGSIGLTWTEGVLEPIKSSGASNPSFAQATTSRVTTTQKVDSFDAELNDGEGGFKEISAFEQTSPELTASKVGFEYSAAAVYDEDGNDSFNDYPLDGDLEIVKVRFKVLKAEDPNFAVAYSQLQELKSTDFGTVSVSIAPVGFAGAAPVEPTPVDAEAVTSVVGDEYQNCGFKATLAYDAAKAGVKFDVVDTANTLTGSVSFPYAQFVGGTVIEGALENITVGLNITNAPLDAVMTATAVLY